MKNYRSVVRSDLHLSGETEIDLATCIVAKSSPADAVARLVTLLLDKSMITCEEAAMIVRAVRVEEEARP